MKRKITLQYIFLLPFLLFINSLSFAQVYMHDFGTTTISSYPYTVAPPTLNANLSNSSWTNSTGAWTSYAGASGQAIALPNSSGTPTITLTFDVATGYELSVTSFNFWRQRSNTGAQSWSMAINGTNVGSGTVPTSGAALGQTPVSNTVTGLTGTVNVTLTLNGATGNGTFRLDNFTLNGVVTMTCIPPVITSFYPSSGPANTLVDIDGSGFTAGPLEIYFNGVESPGYTIVSNSQIKAIVPENATSGPISVAVNGCTGTSLPSFNVISSNCFTFATPGDLFISEVYDAGMGDGGAIEFYNGTGAPIDLSQYSIARYGNVGDAAPTFNTPLNGILADGGVYIARTATEVCGLSGTPATTLDSGFNGGDELQLRKNGIAIDRVYTPTSAGFSMIRNANADAPSLTYAATDWTITTPEDCSNLGLHSIATSSNAHVTAQPLSAAICEGDDIVYTAAISDETGFSYQWKRLNSSGGWDNINDGEHYSGTNTAELTITDAGLNLDLAQFYCEITSPGCTLVSNAVQLTVSPLPVALVIPTQPNCLMATGSLLIIPSVGEGLTYSLDGTNFQSETIFDNLSPGDYTLTILSSAGCMTTLPVTIDDAPTLPATATVTITQPTCSNATGSITITGPVELGFTYSIDGSLYQNDPTFDGLAPGTYQVTVMSALGCISQETSVTINPVPTPPSAPVASVTQPTCNTPTGTITVTDPLDATYAYSINGTNFQAGTTFTGVTPGTYTLTVQTAEGCSSTATVVVDPMPTAPATPVATITQPDCVVATGSIEVTAPLGAEYTYSIDGTNYQSATTFSNLDAGTYTLMVQNTGGCFSQATLVIEQGIPDEAVVTIQQPTCAEPNGNVIVTAPVNANYTYSLDGINFQAETEFQGIDPGTYTLTVQNSNGCTSTTSITIDAAPAGPDAPTAILTQPTCALATGTIEITAPLGSDYTYSIDGTNFQATPIFTGLTADSYTIYVQNTLGCSASANVTLTPATPDAAVTTVTQPNCNTATGTVTVISPVGTDFTYSIDGTNYQSETSFTDLASGTYTLTVQNVLGCTSTATIVVNDAPQVPTTPSADITQPTCATPTGTIEVTAPLGAEYTYSVDGTNFQNSTTFAGLAPDTYALIVQNTDGCTANTSITINAVPTLPNVVTNITQPNCSVTTGTIEITAPTGTEYTYSIDGTNFQAGTTFANLNSGNFTLTVQNTDGCSIDVPFTIDAVPAPPVVATTTVTQPTCSVQTGTIEVTAPLGAEYTYSIDGTNFQSSTTFAGLTAGTYTVTVMGAPGCTSETADITLNQTSAPETPVLNVTQLNCTDITFGTIEVMSPTGTGITYSIDGTNFQSSTTFAGLNPGNYTITVDNGSGCTSTADATINPAPTAPAMAQATVTQPTCAVQTGTLTITSPLGTEYTYSIDGGNTYQQNPEFTGLAAGAQYIVIVMNQAGCTTNSQPYTVDPSPAPAVPTVTVTQPDCFNDTATIEVTAPIASGYTYSLDGGIPQNGYTFINVAPGVHTITVNNTLNGCSAVNDNVVVDPQPETPAVATYEITEATCLNGEGSITVTAPTGNYSYSIDNGTSYQLNTEFTGVMPGTYTIIVMSDGGCTSETAAFTLEQPTGDITITGTEGCRDMGAESNYILEIAPSGNSFDAATATYTWQDQFGNALSGDTMYNVTDYMNQYGINASDLPIAFTVTVTTPGGCTGSYTFNVEGNYCGIPRGISPNNDGMNDNFDISFMNAKKLSIFNRYGEEVYTQANYTNQWYGQSDKGELPTGTYFYVIDFETGSKTGWVYINREVK